MFDSPPKSILPGKDRRRSKTERRMFSYTFHIPERRSGKDRRSFKDPTSKVKKRNFFDVKKY